MTSHPIEKTALTRLPLNTKWPPREFRLSKVSSLFLTNIAVVFYSTYVNEVVEILLRRFLKRSGQKGNV